KMTPARYQTLLDEQIPVVELPDSAGRVRVIAGAFQGHAGPARTFTPMDVWDLRIRQGGTANLTAPEGHTLALVVLHGTVLVNDAAVAREGQLVHLDRAGTRTRIEANNDATVLWLSGEPIDEPVVGYGPFVMNTEEEI